MKISGFIGAAVLFMVATLHAGSSRPEISLRIHVEAGSEVREENSIAVGLVDPEEVIRVERFAVVTEKNLVRVMGTSRGGALLQFDQAGRHSLEAVTSTQAGRTLVVFLNGRLVYAAVIDMPIRSGRFLIPENVLPEELVALEKLIEEKGRL